MSEGRTHGQTEGGGMQGETGNMVVTCTGIILRYIKTNS